MKTIFTILVFLLGVPAFASELPAQAPPTCACCLTGECSCGTNCQCACKVAKRLPAQCPTEIVKAPVTPPALTVAGPSGQVQNGNCSNGQCNQPARSQPRLRIFR